MSNNFYVYLLKSLKNNKRYIGFTTKEPLIRLNEHNQGKGEFTFKNKPFILLYFENFLEEKQARKRERFFKTGNGRLVLDRLIPP